jgi:translation initiation factor IF-2
MGHRAGQQTNRQNPKRNPAVPTGPDETSGPRRLEIVLKCGTDGSRAAIEKVLREKRPERLELAIIHSGVGEVNKNDILLAATASRLIVGFEVGVNPHLEEELRKSGVEVRLYQVIYRLLEDLLALEGSLLVEPAAEQIIGQAKVIALFKGTRHGVILGCQVSAGRLAVGERFRLIGAMGPLYEGRIESLHIEKAEVRAAVVPQQVGLQIHDFQRATVGDLIESFRPGPPPPPVWQAKPGVSRH